MNNPAATGYINIKGYAHREPPPAMADEILHEHMELGRHGHVAALNDWCNLNEYQLLRVMARDGVRRCTVIGTSACGTVLVGIRAIKAPPPQQFDLEV